MPRRAATPDLGREGMESLRDYLTWLRRRICLLVFVVCWYCFSPVIVAKAVVDRFRGENYFSDPVHKHTVWQFIKQLNCFLLRALLCQEAKPSEEALAAAQIRSHDASGVAVKLFEDYLLFTVTGDRAAPRVGAILIPGAFVPPLAYAPLARALAEKGHPTAVLRPPFGLAYWGWQTPSKVMAGAAREGMDLKWVLMGHSLGAAGVGRFAGHRPGKVSGAVIMGSTPTGTVGSLKQHSIPTLLVVGSRDPFTPSKTIESKRDLLPADAEVVVVEGGNHKGFASYNQQPLDWQATVSEKEQREHIVEAVCDFVGRRVK